MLNTSFFLNILYDYCYTFAIQRRTMAALTLFIDDLMLLRQTLSEDSFMNEDPSTSVI